MANRVGKKVANRVAKWVGEMKAWWMSLSMNMHCGPEQQHLSFTFPQARE